jgi:hypothetical protein
MKFGVKRILPHSEISILSSFSCKFAQSTFSKSSSLGKLEAASEP